MSNGKGDAPRNLGPNFLANYDAINWRRKSHAGRKWQRPALTNSPRKPVTRTTDGHADSKRTARIAT